MTDCCQSICWVFCAFVVEVAMFVTMSDPRPQRVLPLGAWVFCAYVAAVMMFVTMRDPWPQPVLPLGLGSLVTVWDFRPIIVVLVKAPSQMGWWVSVGRGQPSEF